MTLEGLSSVCANLEPASSENNKMLEINVPQKLHRMLFLIWAKHNSQNMVEREKKSNN